MRRRQDERDRDITAAWVTVNLAAATWAKGRVPELGPLLTPQPARPQTLAEQRAALELLAQRLGRRLTTRREREAS